MKAKSHKLIPISKCKTVRELLESKDRWIQGVASIDENGKPVSPYDPNARHFCLQGAIDRIYPYHKNRWIRAKIKRYVGGIIPQFNDTHTYQQVMDLVNKLDI